MHANCVQNERKEKEMKPKVEVSPKRMAEYKAIRKSVDERAKRETIQQLGAWGLGSCHTFWAIKKRILRDEYHMMWRSPQDLNPETCFD